jgi:hypothetical protein
MSHELVYQWSPCAGGGVMELLSILQQEQEKESATRNHKITEAAQKRKLSTPPPLRFLLCECLRISGAKTFFFSFTFHNNININLLYVFQQCSDIDAQWGLNILCQTE